MKTSSLSSVLLVLLLSVMFCFGAEPTFKEKLDRIEKGISERVRQIAPDARIVSEEFSVAVKKQVRRIKVPARRRDGSIVENREREVEAPDRNGFLIAVSYGYGKYNASKVRGRKPDLNRSEFTKRQDTDFYHTSALIQLEGSHVVVDISFGEKADDNAILAIFERIEATVMDAASVP